MLLISKIRSLWRKWFGIRDQLQILVRGWFDVVCRNPDGSIAWSARIPNGSTTAGMTDLLNVGFGAASQHTTWYCGLIDNASFSALATADTIASHTGWIEMVAYTESVRQTWTPTVAASAAANASLMNFSINATKTIKGMFLVSDSAKSGVAGVLWATAAFDQGNQVMSNGQTLSVTYTTSLA